MSTNYLDWVASNQERNIPREFMSDGCVMNMDALRYEPFVQFEFLLPDFSNSIIITSEREKFYFTID